QVLQYDREKAPRVAEIPEPQMKGPGVIVDNHASLISVGTEKAMIDLSKMSLAGKARQRPEIVKQVLGKVKTEGILSTYNKVMARLKTPTTMGYSSAGVVREVHSAVDRFSPGDRVACAGFGYACHAEEVFVPGNLVVRIPDSVSFEEASFVTLGAIALQGVRIADVRLGENVAVIGLGLLGQLTCQLLRASGCRVIGMDIDDDKMQLARKLGTEEVMFSDSSAVEKVMEATSGRGVDAVIITAASQSSGPIELAGDIAREKGVVVGVGAVKMDIPRSSYYNKELQFRMSRSYGPGRYDYKYEEAGSDYPFGYVRWTENRNMQSFLELIGSKSIDVKTLITHRFAIEKAEDAYSIVSGETDEKCMGVVLTYPGLDSSARKRNSAISENQSESHSESRDGDKLGVGFVGAGGFATGVLLPGMAGVSLYRPISIMSGGGVSADSAAKRFNFEKAVSAFDEILSDDRIDTVFIANRHDQHAEMVVKSISSGKSTFVEKPLCMNRDELETIRACCQKSDSALMVGFNRRFAPLVQQMRSTISKTSYPVSMYYRINAGFIPSGSWIQDKEVGGGRIIGEVCHFVDLMAFLCGSLPISVHAEALAMPDERYRNDDNLQIMIRFDNGSVCTISYIASGNKAMPKEYIEVIGGGTAMTLDDFRTLTVAEGSKMQIIKGRGQDKGHVDML
ncbi:MAG: bi-domain-containing oxidoreductase, partial [candidate division Zixibacteria bacterium]